MKPTARVLWISLTITILLVLTFGLLNAFRVRMYVEPTESMAPAIHRGDLLLALDERGHPHPQIGDLYAYIPPVRGVKWEYYGRIAGLPGDTILISDGKFVRNEDEIDYPATFTRSLETTSSAIVINHRWTVTGNVPGPDRWVAPDRIPPDCYLILVDNTAGLFSDSAEFGFVPGTASGPCASAENPRSELRARIIRVVHRGLPPPNALPTP